MNKSSILCMFSGGIDSTGVLHELIENEKYKSYNLIVHHIHIRNRERRELVEAKAVKDILYFYKEERGAEFLYSESTFDTRGFASLKSNRFPMDMDTCMYMASQVCAVRPDIKYVARGRTKTDVQGGGERLKLKTQRANAIFNAALSLEKNPPASVILPVVEFTKKEIWDLLPEDVRNHTWWCRRPVYENKFAKACGKCITCKEVEEFM